MTCFRRRSVENHSKQKLNLAPLKGVLGGSWGWREPPVGNLVTSKSWGDLFQMNDVIISEVAKWKHGKEKVSAQGDRPGLKCPLLVCLVSLVTCVHNSSISLCINFSMSWQTKLSQETNLQNITYASKKQSDASGGPGGSIYFVVLLDLVLLIYYLSKLQLITLKQCSLHLTIFRKCK